MGTLKEINMSTLVILSGLIGLFIGLTAGVILFQSERDEKERIAKLLKESKNDAETWKRMYNILNRINGKNL